MNRIQSEQYGEKEANRLLKETYSTNSFLFTNLETVLSDKINFIYLDIEDANFFGASINYQGFDFILLNAHQSVRDVLFTIAHEYFHILQRESPKELLEERAADHFAAVLMLPEIPVTELWRTFTVTRGEKESVVMLADASGMPYIAVAKRLKELHIEFKDKDIKLWNNEKNEQAWLEYRHESKLPDSPLDQPYAIQEFKSGTSVLKTLVDNGVLSAQDAISSIAGLLPIKLDDIQTDTEN